MKHKRMRKYLIGGVSYFACVALSIALIQLAYLADKKETGYTVQATQPIYEQQTTMPLTQEIHAVIHEECEKYGISPRIVYSIIEVESRGVESAENEQCIGLMQLNVTYEKEFLEGAGVEDITAPANNVKAGIWWLSELMSRHDNLNMVLMAYNLGETEAAELWNSGTRTTEYVKAVYEHEGTLL